MSYCRQEGKDRIIFVTKEDHETPSNAELVADDPNDPYEEHGIPYDAFSFAAPYSDTLYKEAYKTQRTLGPRFQPLNCKITKWAK
ncbi:PREDICTED: mitochondrial intermembrane space import and assembly protein 40 [Cercocebus atys]|uniref:mitochondrial intermembrane space import and assembly protein 40 n=1 Tax=Cercocebus atys TaxID=9531 RepID=UPI0005F419E5|nr:PREDICTED: mitochondrial intermembrane space import and assembly protein 40 [Cercocebus atys]